MLPPSLLILATISVFKVGDSISSSKTTILLLVGTLEDVKAFEENRLSEEIDPQETTMTFLFTFWLWLLLFGQLLGGIRYID